MAHRKVVELDKGVLWQLPRGICQTRPNRVDRPVLDPAHKACREPGLQPCLDDAVNTVSTDEQIIVDLRR